MELWVDIEGVRVRVDLVKGNNQGEIEVNGRRIPYDFQVLPDGGISLLLGNRSYRIDVTDLSEEEWTFWIRGQEIQVKVQDPRKARARQVSSEGQERSGRMEIRAPMPGLVVKVLVKVGERVRRGQGVTIVEAMKMENEIPSPSEGVVEEIKVEAGQAVEKGEVLVVVR